jgi:hypothetical protein
LLDVAFLSFLLKSILKGAPEFFVVIGYINLIPLAVAGGGNEYYYFIFLYYNTVVNSPGV